MVLQLVHQTLNQQGLNAPVIHRVCGDQSVLGGCVRGKDLVPGQHLSAQPPEIHATVLGESMARMHRWMCVPLLQHSGEPASQMNTFCFRLCFNVFLMTLNRPCPELLIWSAGRVISCHWMLWIVP